MVGAPYESELCTTLMRMVAAALDRDLEVVVWTCGGATTLTLEGLGEHKPINMLDITSGRRDWIYPSTAAIVRALLEKGAGRLKWLVCRHCSDERAAAEQIEGVRRLAPLKFKDYLESAEAVAVLGVK